MQIEGKNLEMFEMRFCKYDKITNEIFPSSKLKSREWNKPLL